MLACEVIARYVRDAGVTVQFGLLGEANIAIATALQELGVPFVPARREDGAVAMADGWARRSGGVGFVSVTLGPGMTNTVTALTEASRHRTPLVLLTGLAPAGALHNPQQFPTRQLVDLTGAGWREVQDVRSLADDVRAAFAGAVDGRRPYVLGVRSELLYDVVDTHLLSGELPEALPDDWRDRARPAVVPHRDAISAAVDAVAGCRRPVVLVGRGVDIPAARHAAEKLADHLGAPIATTLLGKGLMAGSKRHIGICGGFATAHGADLITDSDLVLALGCSLNPWTATELLHGTTIVHVDTDPAALGRWTATDVPVIGDAGLTAEAVLGELRRRNGPRPPVDRGLLPGLDPRIERRRDVTTEVPCAPFEVGDVALALREIVPDTAVLCSDTGQATADVVSYVEVGGPRQFVYPIHAGAIGLGLGAAIGAALATEDEWVVHVTGDGSLMMAVQELATVAQLRPRLAIVVLDDDGYGAEVLYTEGRGLPSRLAGVPHPDLGSLAAAFGLAYREVATVEDLQGLRSLVDGGGPPTLFHVPIRAGSASRFFGDYSTVPPVASWSGGE